MSNQRNKKPVNNSSKASFTTEILDQVRLNGGSVTYFVKKEKYDYKTEKILLIRQSILTSPLTPFFLSENKEFNSVLKVLTTTAATMGADYFVVNHG